MIIAHNKSLYEISRSVVNPKGLSGDDLYFIWHNLISKADVVILQLSSKRLIYHTILKDNNQSKLLTRSHMLQNKLRILFNPYSTDLYDDKSTKENIHIFLKKFGVLNTKGKIVLEDQNGVTTTKNRPDSRSLVVANQRPEFVQFAMIISSITSSLELLIDSLFTIGISLYLVKDGHGGHAILLELCGKSQLDIKDQIRLLEEMITDNPFIKGNLQKVKTNHNIFIPFMKLNKKFNVDRKVINQFMGDYLLFTQMNV